MPTEIKVEQIVKATPEQVYFAFTHAVSLTEWMCDFATLAARPGGRIYLWWHGDFYSAGEFISLEKNNSIQFEWHSRQDPAPSQVAVGLNKKGTETLVTLIQTVSDGDYWSEHAQDFQKQWEVTLANLAQVLETGLDKRVFGRPTLGINISDFNAVIAQSMGVPVSE